MEETKKRFRARILCVSEGVWDAEPLTELCFKAGYETTFSTSAAHADVAVIDYRGGVISPRRAAAKIEAIRRKSPEAPVLFLVDPDAAIKEAATLQRFGEIVPATDDLDHVIRRIRETLRVRNIAEEAGERLKSLSAVHRAVDFPIIATDDARPRVLIIGPPGPAAMAAINALGAAVETCVCVLTAGQAMRALDHDRFDIAVFLPNKEDAAVSALARALRRHPKFSSMALIHMDERANALAAAARKGAGEFMLAGHISEKLSKRVQLSARRSRLVHSMRGFLRACAGEGVRDPVSGVFTPTFMTQHGARLAARADDTDRPLSVVLVRLTDRERKTTRAGKLALRKAARLLGRVTRAEDMTARVAPGQFAILCPATVAEDAERAAQRIEGVLSNTAFQRDELGVPHALCIDTAVVAREVGASISETVAAASQILKTRAPANPAPRRRSPR